MKFQCVHVINIHAVRIGISLDAGPWYGASSKANRPVSLKLIEGVEIKVQTRLKIGAVNQYRCVIR